MPRCLRSARISSSVRPVSAAMRRSAKPSCLALRSVAGVGESVARDVGLEVDDLAQVLEEPRIDLRQRVDRRPSTSRPGRRRRWRTAGRGSGTRISWRSSSVLQRPVEREPPPVLLEGAHGLLQRLLEGAADGHDLAHRLHLGRERAVGLRELLEGPARDLDHAVVEHRLERGRRLPRDVVADLVEPVADGQLGGDLGDGEAGGLGGQGRGAAHARVHLDDDQPAVVGIDGELDVRAARLHADLADDGDGGVAHQLVFLVGQRLGGGDGDRVAGVHAHRDRSSRSSR